MKRFLHLIFAAALCQSLLAEVPLSYYQSVNGRADADLKNALSTLIYSHREVSSYSNLPSYFRLTDTRDNGRYWWDMYSDMDVSVDITFGTYMNREHAFPKSWWGGLTTTPAYVDLYHLYPGEAKANVAKSNYPLGKVQTATFDNGVSKVGYAVTGQGGGSSLVFEPADEYKGDFARSYFYVVTCYQGLTWTPKYMYMLEQNAYPTLKPWAIDLLLQWSRQDPVSQKEIDRNEEVYKIQNNRNPFIDFPQMAEYIWGNRMGQKFNVGSDQPVGDPVLVTPIQDMALDFSQIALGKSETEQLAFIGHNLTGSLSLAITGQDKAMFSIASKSIASSLVNAEGGYMLNVTYKPTAVGEHSARLIISDGGLTGSRGVSLIGQCFEVPVLSRLVATEATDITASSYTANWLAPNEVVDYYVVTRTRYINGSSSSEDIDAEDCSLVIDDFDDSDSESYHVRSVRLGYMSEPSNEIYVEHSGITGIIADTPTGWAPWPGGVRIVCAAALTNVAIYDLTGRLVTLVPRVENNDIIYLPYGPYLIVSDQSRTPLRVIVSD